MSRLTILTLTIVLLLVPTAGGALVARWQLDDDAASTTVVDDIGTNDGTLVDATGDANTDAHSTLGRGNGALVFDGTDDYVVVADDVVFDINETLSVFVWAKNDSDNLGDAQRLVHKWTMGGNLREWEIHVDTGERVKIDISAKAGTYTDRWETRTTGTVNINKWNHIGFTFDTGTTLVYINGTVVASSTTTSGDVSSNAIWNGAGDVGIGVIFSDGTPTPDAATYWAGLIDGVVVYDSVLTPDEVWALYKAGVGGNSLRQRSRGRGR